MEATLITSLEERQCHQRYAGLAVAILENAIRDIHCEHATPMRLCVTSRSKHSCPTCREQALIFLEGDWARWLAAMVGITPERWEDALRHLRHVALVNNRRALATPAPAPQARRPREEIILEARGYLATHPAATWDDVFRNVPNGYSNVPTLARMLRRHGLLVSAPRHDIERVRERVLAYLTKHPDAGWREIFLKVENHYSSTDSLRQGVRGHGFTLAEAKQELGVAAS